MVEVVFPRSWISALRTCHPRGELCATKTEDVEIAKQQTIGLKELAFKMTNQELS
jgi:hypothetical protein